MQKHMIIKIIRMETIKRIYPTAEQLKQHFSIKCTEENCHSIFQSSANLKLHLLKTHKKENVQLTADKNDKSAFFHCPEIDCIYNQEKSFNSMKSIKQHFLKVHSKEISCKRCNKNFATSAAANIHSKYCGLSFKCLDCTNNYTSYETLQTHARRKKHAILKKQNYLPITNTVVYPKNIKIPKSGKSKANLKLILPKPEIKELLTSTQSTQTECKDKVLKDSISQTDEEAKSADENCKASFGTQTLLDCNLMVPGSLSFESMNSGSQTMCDNNLLGSYYSMETQTDLFDDLLPDFCSNNYTQTYDDGLSNELMNNDIHTQTMFSDLLRSVGSQTLMSSSNSPDFESTLSNCKEISDIQTQTDLVFKEFFGNIDT